MNEFDNTQQKEPLKSAPNVESPYSASIEKMSERWREIQQTENAPQQDQRGFVEKNYLGLGLGIALLVIALIVVIGGFAFLIMRAR